MKIDDKVYQEFLDQLRAAKESYDADPIAGRVNLYLVAKNFILHHCAVPDGMVGPFEDLAIRLIDGAYLEYHGNNPGPKPKPFLQRSRMGFAVAMVTGLRACGWSVGDAAGRVGKQLEIDPKHLRQVRDNLLRGICDQVIHENYERHVRMLTECHPNRVEEEILTLLERRGPRGIVC